MIKELIKIANRLDTLGLKREADTVDGLIKRFAAEADDESEDLAHWEDPANWTEKEWDQWNSETGTFPSTMMETKSQDEIKGSKFDVESRINEIKFNVRIALSLLNLMEPDHNAYSTVHNEGPGFKQHLKRALAGYESLLAFLEENNPYK